MSNLMDVDKQPVTCSADTGEHGVDVIEAKEKDLGGGLLIRRSIPQRSRRMVGPWCFIDHFGPQDLEPEDDGMRVAPHPHIGLQTVTWLLSGEVLHRDSLGTERTIMPGQLNVMTAGKAISHSEETPRRHGEEMHGLQLWVALPDEHRNRDPMFEHHAALPELELGEARITVLTGSFADETSPASAFWPIVGADVVVPKGRHALPLDPQSEHGILVVEGKLKVDGAVLEPGLLGYLAPGRDEVGLEAEGDARFALLGGKPFEEKIMMWWNFVARTPAEIREARNRWQAAGEEFGQVDGYEYGGPLPAPDFGF